MFAQFARAHRAIASGFQYRNHAAVIAPPATMPVVIMIIFMMTTCAARAGRSEQGGLPVALGDSGHGFRHRLGCVPGHAIQTLRYRHASPE